MHKSKTGWVAVENCCELHQLMATRILRPVIDVLFEKLHNINRLSATIVDLSPLYSI